MTSLTHLIRSSLATGLFLTLTSALPLAGLPPECSPSAVPNAPAPAGGPFSCPNPQLLTCDLDIDYAIGDFGATWPAGRLLSDDLRVGDPVSAPLPERPRVIFDAATNTFFAKLFARFDNLGGVPALASAPVTVTFEVDTAPSGPLDTSGPWTVIGSYTMHLPATLCPVGALYPGAPCPSPHVQTRPICWQSAAGMELPRRFMLRATVSWAGTTESDTANNVAYSYIDLAEAKQAADIGLVLDLSGSMSGLQPGAGGASKLDVAKDRAREFVRMIENGDRLGVYGFATGNPLNTGFTATYRTPADVETPAAVLSDTSQIFAPSTITGPGDRNTARAAILTQSAHGCTPVGQGLLRARANFDAAGTLSKSIVVFSDGLQNVAPFVNVPPLFSCGGGGPMPLIDAVNTFDDEEIRIYSIFFGNDWAYGFPLMLDIKNQTGGDFVFGVSTGLQLANAYYSVRNLLDDLLFLEEEGRSSGFGPGPPFSVYFDTAATSATIAIAWPLGAGADLTVEGRLAGSGDWQRFPSDDDPAATPTGEFAVRGGDAHRVLRFVPGPDTTWELRVVQLAPREGGVDYALAVYSDVEAARLEASLGARDLVAGDPLPIFAELRRAGHPIPGARVSAAVRVPARAFSTTLRRYAGRFSAVPAGDAGAISQMTTQLRAFLSEDTGSEEIYVYRTAEVAMADDGQGSDAVAGDGIYSGALAGADTQVAGDYQVTVTANGTTPSGFDFERVYKLGTLVDVGPADPDRSEVVVTVGLPRKDGSRLATITVLATDRFGNATFPGTGDDISIRIHPGGGTALGGVVDSLDSRFTQTVVLDPGEEPSFEVAVGGIVVADVVAEPEPEPEPEPDFDRREASFHLGLAEPHGRLARVVDSGPTFALDWTYRFERNLAVRTELGVSRFDRVFGGGERQLTHLVPFLQFRRPGTPWVPYFETGAGYYDLESSGSAFGFAAGIGALRRISGRWLLDFGLHGHRVGGRLDLSFSTLRVGVLYTY